MNGRRGVVSGKRAKKPGCVAVVLEGDTKPTLVKLENLRWQSVVPTPAGVATKVSYNCSFERTRIQ